MVQDNVSIAEGVKILDFGLAKIKSGELRPVRVGKANRLLEDDVDAYLADRFTQAG